MTRSQRACPVATAVLVFFVHPAFGAEAAETSLSFGADYSEGRYGGSQPTRIAYFPLTFKYDADRYALSITASLVAMSSPGSVVAGVGPTGTGTVSKTQTQSGPGDVIVKTSVNAVRQTDQSPRIDFTARAKIATADANRELGTGRNDYALQIDVERTRGGNAVFGSVGGKVMGDPPGIDYRNVAYGSAGVMLALRDSRRLSAILDAQGPLLDAVSGQRTFTIVYGDRLDAKTRISLYAVKGLSTSSPDWALGIVLRLIR